MTTFRVLLSIFLFLPIVYGQASEDAVASIKRAVTLYDEAWNKKNIDDVSKILMNDYVYFSSTGGLTDRKATLAFLASPDYKLTLVERSEIKIVSRTERVAVVSSRWKGRGTYGKEEINDDQRCGLVFVKENKAWKLFSEHCAQIVSK
jgi:ketosteroid isomerase-like protein